MKIMKFGGTSVGKPERMHEVAKLIIKDEESKIVVLSALSGTTNSLVEISNSLANADRNTAKHQIEALEAHYQNFITKLVKTSSSVRAQSARRDVWLGCGLFRPDGRQSDGK